MDHKIFFINGYLLDIIRKSTLLILKALAKIKNVPFIFPSNSYPGGMWPTECHVNQLTTSLEMKKIYRISWLNKNAIVVDMFTLKMKRNSNSNKLDILLVSKLMPSIIMLGQPWTHLCLWLSLWRTAPGDAVLERSIENRCIKNSKGSAMQHANLGTEQVVSLCSP